MGLHFCVNVVCEREGHAAAVLLRALEPTNGLAAMRQRRGLDDARRLCSGPAKLTQALAITRADDGHIVCDADAPAGEAAAGLTAAGLTAAGVTAACVVAAPGRACFLRRDGVEGPVPESWSRAAPRIVTTPRIGVAAAPETPWRFVDADSPFLSRSLPRARRR